MRWSSPPTSRRCARLLSPASVKQHRAVLSKAFDFLVVRQIVASNPVAHVSGPRIVTAKGKTAVLVDDEFLDLLAAIPRAR